MGSLSRGTNNSQTSQPARYSHGPPRRQVPNRDERMLPVTARQLMEAAMLTHTSHPPEISGVRPTTLVGMMWNLITDPAKATFLLNDCTGAVKCTYWMTGLQMDYDISTIGEGDYVEIFGWPEVNDSVRHLTVFSCRNVTNYNLITQHFLYCIYTHLDLRRPPPAPTPQLIKEVYNIIRDYTDQGDPGLSFRFIRNRVVGHAESVVSAGYYRSLERIDISLLSAHDGECYAIIRLSGSWKGLQRSERAVCNVMSY
ncbi:replication protein A 32 kDa subunit B-like isoform X2 [Brachypodium distachyon]|uniref:replication protein A 32 kDa subunit B-like isoform X2 n=1 Tax=Brachypodium distachyon TaxID=15368 RepID=UPI000D0DDA83|nr:replication protein A 32 kDa subunit B-like isoform X2 [Brachypodium distachyon]|eukprot:XP_024311791.1 replication protein A 32 kDa subunit B-like isoform X2 [Brachypodium distachyon]